MNAQLFDTIVNRKHHTLRRTVDLDLATEYSQAGLLHVERMTRRFELLTSLEEPVILEGERISFMRTVSNIPDIILESERNKCRIEDGNHIHEWGCATNVNPNYGKVIGKGLLAMREEADEYEKRYIDSILSLTDRYKEKAESLGRSDIAALLTKVPRYPAESFLEALQFFRIIHFSLWLEGNTHMTVGRFDQYMYPYFKRDMDSGVLNEESALDLIREFFLSFNRDSDLYPGVQQGDNGQSMMLGGVNAKGEDVYNELSRLCLKASCENKLIDPKINLRVSKNTPTQRFTEATELTKVGLGFPQYSNDDVVIPGLIKLGYAPEDAADYTVAACWEFIIPGLGFDIPNIDALSFPLAVDQAMRLDMKSCPDYESFYRAVEKRIGMWIDEKVKKYNKVYVVPSPLLGMCMDFNIYEGGKYNNYGIHGVGVCTAADSLAAIRKYVYEEGSLSKDELILAIDKNFEGYPELLHKLRYEAPKVGFNDDATDAIATALLDSFAAALKGKKNSKGGIYRAGTGSAMNYLWKANEIGASADGRLAKEPFGANYSVSLFAKVPGPVSVIGSMTKQHFTDAINGGPLTMEFHNTVFAEEDGTAKVAALVKRYIELGGHQLQLNAVNPELLLDAKAHPENHKQLIVRIWGWSAYFTELAPEYQDHVIARQVYKV